MHCTDNNFIECPLGGDDGSCKDPSEAEDTEGEGDDNDDDDDDGEKGGKKRKGKKKGKGKGKGKDDGDEDGSGCPAGTLVYHGGSHCCKEKVDKNGNDITYDSMHCKDNNFIECPLGGDDGSCKDPSEADDTEDEEEEDDDDGKKGGKKGKKRGKGKKKGKGKGKGKDSGDEDGSGCPAGTLVYHGG